MECLALLLLAGLVSRTQEKEVGEVERGAITKGGVGEAAAEGEEEVEEVVVVVVEREEGISRTQKKLSSSALQLILRMKLAKTRHPGEESPNHTSINRAVTAHSTSIHFTAHWKMCAVGHHACIDHDTLKMRVIDYAILVMRNRFQRDSQLP